MMSTTCMAGHRPNPRLKLSGQPLAGEALFSAGQPLLALAGGQPIGWGIIVQPGQTLGIQ